MPFPVRTPQQSEPKSIAEFLRAGHPWMALAIALSWLWRPAVIAFALLTIGVFTPPHEQQSLPNLTQANVYANAQIAPERIK